MKKFELCHRCEHHASYYETGIAQRGQCVGSNTFRCYMYSPVKPIILMKEKNDPRPQFCGILSARSYSRGIAECSFRVADYGKKGAVAYWIPKILEKAHLEAQKTLSFLECHPAIGSPVFSFFSLFDLSIDEVCTRGFKRPHKGCVDIYWNKDNYKRFKKQFDMEFEKYSKDELKCKNLISIRVPYKALYGEIWEPDHIEYTGWVSFVVFNGKNFNLSHDQSKWKRVEGIKAKAESFENLIIKLGKKFKRVFGNFSQKDFYTEKEKNKNNKGKLFLSPAEINHRWWTSWFSKTSYCKKYLMDFDS